MNTEKVKLSQISVNSANPRQITDEKFQRLVNSILVLPKMLELRPIVVDDTMVALGGNMRYRALMGISGMKPDELKERLSGLREFQKKTRAEKESLLSYWERWQDSPTAPVIKASALTDDEKREFIIKDNVGFGDWNMDMLANEWDNEELQDWGLDVWGSNDEWDTGSGKSSDGSAKSTLFDRFVVPPFSILDTRKGYWQARKKMWREKIGGDKGKTREDLLISSPEMKYKDLYRKTKEHREELGISFKEYIEKYVPPEVIERQDNSVLGAGVSLFDPVLSETMCKWFTPCAGASIFDCFAGDTQKGLVFAMCGFSFRGVELRREQVDINNKDIGERGLDIGYICDDGRNVARHFESESQDLLFSCPPYFDLEKYSDLPNDASNQRSYEDFLTILRDAFTAAVGCLKDNRFAVIVVGDVRDKSSGFYHDLPGGVKRIFKDAGMRLYNEIILVETGASTSIRAGKYMETRKVAKMHQNVLVFYKGNPKDIRAHFPKIEYTPDDELEFAAAASPEKTSGSDIGDPNDTNDYE